MSEKLGEAVLQLSTDGGALEKGIKHAHAQAKGLGEAFKQMGHMAGFQLQMAGMNIAMLTAPLVAGIGLTVKAASDFESAFAGVRKTVEANEVEFAHLSESIRAMAKELPASTTEIAKVVQEAGQLGIQTEHLMSFSRVMIDLGVSTDLGAEQAAMALARLANITQMPQDQFDRLGATVVDLGNKLAATETEIVEMGMRIAGAGKVVGLTEAQILAFAGALSSVGIQAEMGGSAISRVFIKLANAVATGGESLQAFAGVARMSAAEFAAAFKSDPAEAIITFIEGLGRMQKAGENVFAVLDSLELSEIRVRDAMLRASGAGDLFRQSLEIGNKAWQDNTALTTEAGRRYETFASQLTVLKNRIMDVANTAGKSLLPVIIGLVKDGDFLIAAADRMAKSFAALPQELRLVAIGLVAVTAALGPLIIVAGLLVGSLMTLKPILIGLLGTLSAAAVPIAAVVAGLALMVAYWDGIAIAAERAYNATRKFFGMKVEKASDVAARLEADRKALDEYGKALNTLLVSPVFPQQKVLAPYAERLAEALKKVNEAADADALRAYGQELAKLSPTEQQITFAHQLAEGILAEGEAARKAALGPPLLADEIDKLTKSMEEMNKVLAAPDKIANYQKVIALHAELKQKYEDTLDPLKKLREEQERLAKEAEKVAKAVEKQAEAFKKQADAIAADLIPEQDELFENTELLIEVQNRLMDAWVKGAIGIYDYEKALANLQNRYLGLGQATEEAAPKIEVVTEAQEELADATKKVGIQFGQIIGLVPGMATDMEQLADITKKEILNLLNLEDVLKAVPWIGGAWRFQMGVAMRTLFGQTQAMAQRIGIAESLSRAWVPGAAPVTERALVQGAGQAAGNQFTFTANIRAFDGQDVERVTREQIIPQFQAWVQRGGRIA